MLKHTIIKYRLVTFGYSVQGIENIRNEIQDTMEPLIDPVHGHGRYKYTSLYLLSISVRQLQKVKHFCVVNGRGKNLCNFFTLLLSNFLYNFCSQSLVNLLVTGHAVSNVWDGDRECSGLSKTSLKLMHTYKQAIFTQQSHQIHTQNYFVAPSVNHIH